MPEKRHRELTASQRDAWEMMSHAFQVLPGALDTQLQRSHGLSYAAFCVLQALVLAPKGEMRMRLLAQRASVSMSRLSHLADRLEDQGLLARHTLPEDRRSTIAVVTPAGRALVADSRPTLEDALVGLVFEPLTEEQVRGLREVFATLHNRMDPERRGTRTLRR